MFAFVNNFIEIRTDGFTLLHHTRRPWPTGASDIGIWMSFLEFMSNASAVANRARIEDSGSGAELHNSLARPKVVVSMTRTSKSG